MLGGTLTLWKVIIYDGMRLPYIVTYRIDLLYHKTVMSVLFILTKITN